MARKSNDDKLISENPNASPYELLTKGLSEKKYNELLSQTDKTEPIEEIKPKRLVPEVTAVATPKLMPLPHVYIASDTVQVRTKEGKVIEVSPQAAQRMVKKSYAKYL